MSELLKREPVQITLAMVFTFAFTIVACLVGLAH